MPSATIQAPETATRASIALAAVLALLAALLIPPAATAERREWLTPMGSVLPAGAQVVGSYPVAGMDVVSSPTKPAGGVALDTELRWQSDDISGDGPLEEGFVDAAMSQVGAEQAWDDGITGEGALVALIDTGVAPVEALQGAVVGEVDFSGAGGGDGFGHGTYMASLIAARGATAPGVAPDAGVLSLKVADDEGSTSLGEVLGALQWLHGPGRSLGVRVATLAIGVDPTSPAAIILDTATARLASAGTVVVTATGNDEEEQELTSPSTSPGTLSAGALDGDEVADFSASGVDRLGVSQPDVLAPGVDVYGHIDPESAIAVEAAADADEAQAERLAEGHVRGSGTSAAAALVSGTAALVSSEHPDLDGLELALALGKGSEGADLDVQGALAAADDITAGRPDVETLPNGKARPLHPHTAPYDLPLPPVAEWTAAEWNGAGWSTDDWAGQRWDDDVWGLGRPQVAGWNVAKWHVADWTAEQWNAVPWDGSDWDAANWNVAKWHVAKWHVAKWHGDDWDVAKWHAGWDVAKWHADWEVAKWHVAKWHVAKWHAAQWNVAKWHNAHWNVAKWHGAGWDVAKWHQADWDVAKWHGDDWDVAKWHVAKWHVAKWHVAKWHGAGWNVAKWHGANWNLSSGPG